MPQQQTEEEILRKYGGAISQEQAEDEALRKLGGSVGGPGTVDPNAISKFDKAAGIQNISIPMYNAQGQITAQPGAEPLSTFDKWVTGGLSWLTSGGTQPESERTLEAGRQNQPPPFLQYQKPGEGQGGMTQLGYGMHGLSHPQSGEQMAGAAADVIEGGFTVATPAMLPAMWANPLAAATGLGTFMGAAELSHYAGEKVGIPEGYNRLLSNLIGIYGGAKVHGWINKFGEIPDQRVANAIFQRTLAAAESLNDPKLSPTERAATKAGLDAMMGSLTESERWGMPGFFEGVKGTGAAAGIGHVPGPAGPPIRLTGKALWHYQYLVNLQRKSPQEALQIALTGVYNQAMPGEKRFGVKNQLTPEAQANEEWFRQQGIQTPLGMQTENKAAQNLGAVIQNLPGGGVYGEKMGAAKEKLVKEVAPKVLAEVAPGLQQTQEEVASAVQQQLRQNLTRRQDELARLVHPEPTTAEEAGTALGGTLRKDLAETKRGLAEEVFPGQPMTGEAAGSGILKRGQEDIRRYDQAADESYKAAWRAEQHPGNIERVPTGEVDAAGNPITEKMALPIDMRPVAKALKPLADRYERTLSETDARASLGLKTMRAIIREVEQGRWHKPASAAELDLGLLKEAARTETGMAELRDPSQGMAAKSVAELQAAIDAKMGKAKYPGWDPASGTPSPAVRHLGAGREATFRKHEVAEAFAPFGSRDLTKIEGGRVFQGLTWEGDAGLNRLRRMADLFPDQMGAIGRAFIEGGGNWEKLGPETKKILFKDEGIIKGLDKHYAEEARFGPLTKLEPVALFERLTAKGGKRINLLQDVLEKYPQHREQIGRAFIDSGGNWENLDAATRKALFKDDRALIASLDEYYENRARFEPLIKLEPVNLFKRMTAPGGRHINLTQEILAQTPKLREQIARAFFEGLFDTATREGNIQNVQTTLDAVLKMDEKTLHALVPDPKIRQNMLDLFLGMKRLVANPNPSGSGLIAALTKLKGNVFTGLGALVGYGGHGTGGGVGGGAEGLLAGAALEIGSNAALARLLFNQKFIDMLNRGVREANRGNTAGAKLAARTLEKIIGEIPPEEPPAGPGAPGGGPSGGGGGRTPGSRTDLNIEEFARELTGKSVSDLTNDEWLRVSREFRERAETPPSSPGSPTNPPQAPAGSAGGGTAPTETRGAETPESRTQDFIRRLNEFIGEEEGASPSRRGTPMSAAELMGRPEEVFGGTEAPRTLKLKPTGEGGQLLTSDVGQALENAVHQRHRLGREASPERKKARALESMIADLRYALAEDDAGRGWYTKDVAEMERLLSEHRPEFRPPEKMGLFKYLLGIVSNGVDPEINFDAALRGWDMYQRDGKFSAYDATKTSEFGNPKGLGLTFRANGYEGAMNRLNQLVVDKGEAGAVEWLKTKHPVSELRQYYDKVPGKATDERYGAYIFGEKVGSFGLNLNGIHTELTADKWWSRSWNRWMGTLMDRDAQGNLRFGDDGNPRMQETPRNEGERNLMRETATKVANDLGLEVDELQALLWYTEQRLYRFYGIDASSVSYADAAKNHFGRNVRPGENAVDRGPSKAGGPVTQSGKAQRSPPEIPQGIPGPSTTGKGRK